MRRQITLSWLAAAIFMLMGPAGQAKAQVKLFGPVDSSSAGKTALAKSNLSKGREAVKRSNFVSLKNPQGLQQSSLFLNLFSDKTFKINRENSEDNGQSMQSWRGKIEGDSLSSVIIHYKDKWLSGRVSRPGELYTFDVDPNGTITILDLDESKLLRELEVIEIR